MNLLRERLWTYSLTNRDKTGRTQLMQQKGSEEEKGMHLMKMTEMHKPRKLGCATGS